MSVAMLSAGVSAEACSEEVGGTVMPFGGSAFGGDAEQQRLLEAEGVAVVDYHVDLEKYQMR